MNWNKAYLIKNSVHIRSEFERLLYVHHRWNISSRISMILKKCLIDSTEINLNIDLNIDRPEYRPEHRPEHKAEHKTEHNNANFLMPFLSLIIWRFSSDFEALVVRKNALIRSKDFSKINRFIYSFASSWYWNEQWN